MPSSYRQLEELFIGIECALDLVRFSLRSPVTIFVESSLIAGTAGNSSNVGSDRRRDRRRDGQEAVLVPSRADCIGNANRLLGTTSRHVLSPSLFLRFNDEALMLISVSCRREGKRRRKGGGAGGAARGVGASRDAELYRSPSRGVSRGASRPRRTGALSLPPREGERERDHTCATVSNPR